MSRDQVVMKLKNVPHAIAVLSLVLSTQIFGEGKSHQPIRILSDEARRLIVEFSVREWTVDVVPLNGGEFTSVDFEGASLIDEPGAPQIPYHVAVLGIPVGGGVSARVIETEQETLEGVKLLPHPQIKKVEDWPQKEYLPDAQIYSSSQPYPLELIKIDPPAFFREQQIAVVQVAGAQYYPDRNQIVKYNRIVLQIEFVGGERSGSSAPLPQAGSEETIYKKMLINYEQARAWRKSDVRVGSQKQSAIQAGETLYKFTVAEEGMYKIDGALLESKGVTLAGINPAQIRLFNNGGREVPQNINAIRPEGLIENAIIIVGVNDGRFDRSDYILFYGQGVQGWQYTAGTNKFSHYLNRYTSDNVYWLSLDGGQPDGKRIADVSSEQLGGGIRETYQGLAFVEEELNNPLRSGLNFFGKPFSISEVGQRQSFTLNLPNASAVDPAQLQVRLVSANEGIHRFAMAVNDNVLGSRQFSGSRPAFDQYLIMQVATFSLEQANILRTGSNSVTFNYSHSTNNGQAYLDWFELFYTAQLNAVDNQLAFTVFPDVGLQTYRISNLTSSTVELFDVSDFANIRRMVNFNLRNGQLTFADEQAPAQPKRYLVLDPSKYKSIQNLERTEYTDLRAPGLGGEFIIITHDDFYSEALRLESLRENGNPDNRMVTEVVRISDVYANFSGGLLDPTAIRDFLKYAYDNWSPKPLYVLLLGDGDYDYKNIISRADANWIPTFQTDELQISTQLAELESRTTDSWFTYLSGDDTVMDLAIGRINTQSLTEARNVIDKIIVYETQPERGGWHNTITFVGDDELVASGRPSSQDVVHIQQSETIAETDILGCFDIEKIYLSEFPKVLNASVGGVRKPAAQEALLHQINQGTLIVNYIGHGNSSVWAHETVFEQRDNDRVQNSNRLPLFIAATCDWALYDNPQRQSQAEELLLAERRGAIAILSSARLVFSSGNFSFNRFFYNGLFNPGGTTDRLGDAFVFARVRNRNTVNDEKFHLYGDPTLYLAVPKYQAVITSMSPDSILALSTIDIQGEIQRDGQVWSEFNGKALINTFDSKKFVQHVPEAGSTQRYFLSGNSIYRGTVAVQNGRFTARFIVPKDISYGGKLARISAYVWNDEADGSGCRENILVSSSSATLVDNQGPEIKLYFKGQENFASGDIVGENATLVVELADTVSGINIAGEIGHRLTLNIDPEEETCLSELNRFRGISGIDLTDLFQFKEGDHLRGTVEFPITFPEEVDIAGRTVSCRGTDGEIRHALVVKAWDNANNSSSAALEVLVVNEEGLVVREVMNYPNPFAQNTTFTFISNRDAEVTIKIYTVAGQLIQTLERQLARAGFNMIDWDGRDLAGDRPANGVYLYKLIARSLGNSEVSQKEVIGKLAILR